MAIIHFKTESHRYGGTTSLCQKYALHRRGYPETTENKNEVSCTRCAKQLGITPAAKAKRENEGTCPFCFNLQCTKNNGKMVNHGYRRPGCGYIIGNCFCVGWVPFEVSNEGTLYAIEQVKKAINHIAQVIVTHEKGLDNYEWSYSYTVRNENGRPIVLVPGTRTKSTVWESEKVSFVVARGDAVKKVPSADPHAGWSYKTVSVPSYEQLRAEALDDAQRAMTNAKRDLAWLKKMADSWKPGWTRDADLEQALKAQAKDDEAEVEAAQARRYALARRAQEEAK